MTAHTSPPAPRRFRWPCAAWLAAAALCLSGPAVAEDAPQRALKLHDQARTLYSAGKYEDAIARLEEAVRLDPEGKVLFYNLGLIEEKLGRIKAAESHYRRCLELEKDAREREHLNQIIERLAGAERYTSLGKEAGAAGGQQSAPVAPAPPPDSGGVSPWVWVTGAAAASALVVGVSLSVRAASLHPGAAPTTGPDVSLDELRDDAEQAHSLAIGADVAFGVALAASAATVVLAITTADAEPAGRSQTGERGSQRPDRAGLRLELAPGRGRLVWRF